MDEISGLLVTFLPLFVVLFLANLAQRQRLQEQDSTAATAMSYALLLVTYAGCLVAGLGVLVIGGDLLSPALPPDLAAQVGLDQVASLSTLVIGFWAPALIGAILLLPAVRRWLAHILPIDPTSPVDAVALSMSMLVLVNLLTTLGVGLGNVAELLQKADAAGSGPAVTQLGLWLQQILMALLAMVGVGWGTRRSLGETLTRLGLVVPTGRQLLLGFAMAWVMVGIVLVIGSVAQWLGAGAGADVENLTEQLIGVLFESPLGILTLGLAAALGEEPLFRGAALPRFGIVLTSVIFALLHSNYGITIATLIVFLLGLMLGWLRLRHNTTTAMITHAVYNISFGLLAYLSINLVK